MTNRRSTDGKAPLYHGWILAAALWLYYGVTLGLKAGLWGFFAPEITNEVPLTSTEIGLVAGILLGGASLFMPLAGLLIGHHGPRTSMVLGLCVGIAGMLLMGAATTLAHLVIAALLLAASTSFAGLIPIVTLIAHWFDRFRSRAMAAIFTASPIWGALSYPLYGLMLEHMSWRASLAWLTLILPTGLLLTVLFIRNRPEDMGQTIDGASVPQPVRAAAPVEQDAPAAAWTIRGALVSLPFATITLSTSVAMMPFLYFQTFGRLFLRSVNVPATVAVGTLMSLTIASLFGRLVAATGDFVETRLLMLGSLVGNAIGIALVVASREPAPLYAGVFLLGASFGLSLLLAPLLLARTFGGRIFSTVEGVRSAIVIGVNAGLTPCFGMLIDRFDSYVLPFLVVLVLNIVAIVATAAQFFRTVLRDRKGAMKRMGESA